MLQAKLSEIKCVSLEGLKQTAKITKADDLVYIGKDLFIRLATNNSSLVALICEDNDLAPAPVPKNCGLSQTLGYHELIKLRNQTQAAELAGDGCNLFGDEAPASKKKPRVSQKAMKEMREKPEVLTVELPEYGEIKCLRPIHSKDALFVEYDAQNLTRVFNFLRQAGFDDELSSYGPRDPSLPKGVWKRGNCYLVLFKKAGVQATKTCDSLETVHAFIAQQQTSAEDLVPDEEAEPREAEVDANFAAEPVADTED